MPEEAFCDIAKTVPFKGLIVHDKTSYTQWQHQILLRMGEQDAFYCHEVLFPPSTPIISSQQHKNSSLSDSCCSHATVWQACFLAEWFSLLSNWNLEGNLPAAHCREKCSGLDNATDYRICSKVKGQWRQHLEVNTKNFIVLGEGCESSHSCVQNAGKRRQFCGKLDGNIWQENMKEATVEWCFERLI